MDFLVAQAVVEHGLLNNLGHGIARLRYAVDAYVGDGGSTYVIVGAVVCLAWLLLRRRR